MKNKLGASEEASPLESIYVGSEAIDQFVDAPGSLI
jgi:hypothetical protein